MKVAPRDGFTAIEVQVAPGDCKVNLSWKRKRLEEKVRPTHSNYW
jgi:hypothetical protein